MTAEEQRNFIRATVHETLTVLGIDASDPIKAQADFTTMREVIKYARDPEFRKDLEHTRWWRLAVNRGLLTIVATAAGGLVWAIWLGIKTAVGK